MAHDPEVLCAQVGLPPPAELSPGPWNDPKRHGEVQSATGISIVAGYVLRSADLRAILQVPELVSLAREILAADDAAIAELRVLGAFDATGNAARLTEQLRSLLARIDGEAA